MLTPEHRKYLNSRGINDESIAAYGLDSNGRSIVIPVGGTARIYTPNGNPKIRWIEPLDDAAPPYPNWECFGDAELIVEGEFDCILARQHGFHAVTGTAGAGTFSSDWADAIRNTVVILYDNDASGRNGSRAAAAVLRSRGINVNIAEWPRDTKKGYDIADFFADGGTAEQLQDILACAVPYEPEQVEGLKSIGEGGIRADLDTAPVIASGFDSLDQYIWGLRRGEAMVLAARPKVGKSTLASQIACNVARRGLRVALFSLEMSENQVLERIIASEAQISKTHLERGLCDEEVVKLYEYLPRIWNMQVLISTTLPLSPKDLAKFARAEHEKAAIDVIVVDYLQLLNVSDKKETRARNLMAAMEDLKGLAKELDCAVILLSQINRGGAIGIEESDGTAKGKTRDEEPQLHQLYESGGIEAHADTVVILWRKRAEEKNAIESHLPVPTHGRVAKNRNGPEGYFALSLDGPTYTFYEDTP